MRRWSVLLAGHLVGHPSLPSAEAVLADLRNGRPAAAHLSPMKNARRAFKRAHRRGNWVDYKRMMDHLLNKWDFHHFHCAGGSVLVFVHLCEETSVARVLDLVPHDGNWLVERRLVEIAVRNWPASGIVRCFGKGPSSMTEQDLFDARKQGMNMPVNVDGTYYLPQRGALMCDGSGYGGRALGPLVITGRRFERGMGPRAWVDSHQMLMIGLDPDDPRPPWEIAATEAATLASRHPT